MKNTYIRINQSPFRGLGLAILLVLGSSLFTLCRAQIAINPSGNTNEVGAILDLSNSNTAGNAGFLLPYVALTNTITTFTNPITNGVKTNLSGLMVFNTTTNLSGAGAYYWNNPANNWVYLAPGQIKTGSNGVSQNITTLQLGLSPLIQATDIKLKAFTLTISGDSTATNFVGPNGQVGMGTATPDAKAVLDLNNTTAAPNTHHWGLMLPGMTAAKLPPITASEDGLLVYNSSNKCPEYASTDAATGVTSWHTMMHGTLSFYYTGAIRQWTVPTACVENTVNNVDTITVICGGGDGGYCGVGGGVGACIIAKIAVTPGHTLDIVCGGAGAANDWNGGGGGGGTFVYDNGSTAAPLVAAGGGGGGGYVGSTNNEPSTIGAPGSASVAALDNFGTKNGTSGTNGTGGAFGANGESGGGGGGWVGNGTPAAFTATRGQGGFDKANLLVGGECSSNPFGASTYGGYGAGGGGGYDASSTWGAGGGGGGFNGGGGGSEQAAGKCQYGGAGGGSGYNTVNPPTIAGFATAPTYLGNSSNNPSVIIIF